MAKRLKLKLSQMIPRFQLCRCKNPSSQVDTPVPLTHILSPFNSKALDIIYPKLPSPPPTTPEVNNYSSINPRKIVPRSKGYSDLYVPEDYSYDDSVDFANKKDIMNWVAAKSILENKKRDKLSLVSEDLYDSGCFSTANEAGENDEETENLLFSRSFRYDTSCEFSQPMASSTSEESENEEVESKENRRKTGSYNNGNNNGSVKKLRRKLRRQVTRSWSRLNMRSKKALGSLPPETRPASVFKRLVPCTVDGKVKESVAVVKKSEDPYEDFKRSMMEMILEQQMFQATDLEELLQCFLSLNSRQYHAVIVEAFSEIWEVLFCDSQVEKRVSAGRF